MNEFAEDALVLADKLSKASADYLKVCNEWQGRLGEGLIYGGDEEDNNECERMYKKVQKAAKVLRTAIDKYEKRRT